MNRHELYEGLGYIGGKFVEFAPVGSEIVGKGTAVIGAVLIGYGCSESAPLAIAGVFLTPIGLLVDKARERVMIEVNGKKPKTLDSKLKIVK
jgi:hypothetical protein